MNIPLVIYLASRSPRRVELLKQMGLDCTVMPSDIDESRLDNEAPADYVMRLARQKAEACVQVLQANAAHIILAADTTVELNGDVLNKPQGADEAYEMLHALSGRRHQVHTAVAVAYQGSIEVALSTTQVEMMVLSEAQITQYIESGEPFDKAGAYGIQGHAGAWIKRIEGSYTGVMGLPVFETAALLRNTGLLL